MSNYNQEECDTMTWQDNYQVWKNYQDLDPALAQELADMANDQEALENAFTKPMAFGTLACVV